MFWPVLLVVVNQLVRDPGVHSGFVDLVRESSYGWSKIEFVAFVVRDGDGYRFVAWPHTHEYRQEHYRGALPDRVVAIVHTHPRDMPRPSVCDRSTARRLKIPVFVLTPDNVYVAMPDGDVVAIVKDSRWTP